MLGLEIVVVLGVAILVCAGGARRLHIASPVLLLISGILLGFLPAMREVSLPPEVVLFLFLPALLFRESLTTSLREIRANFRGIVLTSTLLVVLTAGAVAVIAHLFGTSWGPAWVLGAALAPTDATSVGALTRNLPRRNVTLLRAESLINDGTALVIYGIAVAFTVSAEDTSPLHITWLAFFAYGGGIAIGAMIAWLVIRIRRRLDNPMQEIVLTILTPFVAYLLAELIEASGVLAVVTAGLLLSQATPRRARAAARRQSDGFWSLSTFLLNASLFVIVGLELQTAVRALDNTLIVRGLVLIAVVSVVLIAVRIGFLFAATYTIRLLDRRPAQRLRRVSNRARIVSGLAGFRGAVSLAAALGIPLLLASGHPFPDRDLIVFVTAGVIVITIVVEGILLPGVVRWAAFEKDAGVDEERLLAETVATEEALDALAEVATGLGTDPAVSDRLRTEYGLHLRVLRAGDSTAEVDDDARRDQQYTALRLEILERKRATVVRLRNDEQIDDAVLRWLQGKLDTEELRLAPEELRE
ncbi:Na+/H+ antiporter [Lacisediminihabitans profunda]|uniref:Na+/H+ antiporter n=1 Tax=Lacisediminihabitans profunda TaxID=2594790 RepID=A0A5C8UNL9_9MICO|nr:Na+/H+ antiporter [Lacisediminihabitans profunda]TXN28897.1 Na+/H+ antiporter [Lacisediminihabitans profunda]